MQWLQEVLRTPDNVELGLRRRAEIDALFEALVATRTIAAGANGSKATAAVRAASPAPLAADAAPVLPLPPAAPSFAQAVAGGSVGLATAAATPPPSHSANPQMTEALMAAGAAAGAAPVGA